MWINVLTHDQTNIHMWRLQESGAGLMQTTHKFCNGCWTDTMWECTHAQVIHNNDTKYKYTQLFCRDQYP